MSALRGVKPAAVKKRLKIFIYGVAKIGKSTASISFPAPYWIDTEMCADKQLYVEQLEKQNGLVFQTQDIDEVITEVTSLIKVKHQFKTLIIDSFTIIYNDALHKAELKVGSEYGRHINEANKKVKHLLNLLLRIDMNVIITSHSKVEYASNMTVIGNTFDCYRKLDYLFDLIIEVQKQGNDRIAVIRGTRFQEFKQNDRFPFCYAEIESRYGRENLERNTISEKLSNTDQIIELNDLINSLSIQPSTQQKWLDKANAESFSEMLSDDIQKCIDYLKKMLPTKLPIVIQEGELKSYKEDSSWMKMN